MHKYTVYITPSANLDIADIYGYIFFILENPMAAENILTKIRQKCDRLSFLPLAHPVIVVRNGRSYRSVHAANYTIIYHVDEKNRAVYIDYVVYSRRDIGKLLK